MALDREVVRQIALHRAAEGERMGIDCLAEIISSANIKSLLSCEVSNSEAGAIMGAIRDNAVAVQK